MPRGKKNVTTEDNATPDVFDLAIASQEFQTQVNSSLTKVLGKQKVTVNADVTKDYLENKILVGVPNNDAGRYIQYLESEATAVRIMGQSIDAHEITIGKILADAKVRIQHGSFSAFVQNRIGMDVTKAQRYMGMARAVTLYPQIAAVAGNIPNYALADIGRAKDLTEDKVNELSELAGNRMLDVAKTSEVLGRDREKKENPVPFTPLDKNTAVDKSEDLMKFIEVLTHDISPTKTEKAAKHGAFTEWLTEMRRKPASALQTEIRKLCTVAWELEYSIENPSELVEMPADGSPIVTPMPSNETDLQVEISMEGLTPEDLERMKEREEEELFDGVYESVNGEVEE